MFSPHSLGVVVLCSLALSLSKFSIFLPNMEEASICLYVASTLFVAGSLISGLLGQLHSWVIDIHRITGGR